MTVPGYTAEVTLYRSTQTYRLSAASRGGTERVQEAIVAQELPSFGPDLPPFCGPGCSYPGVPRLQWCCGPTGLGWLCWPRIAPRCPT
jgi:hypothetical protein